MLDADKIATINLYYEISNITSHDLKEFANATNLKNLSFCLPQAGNLEDLSTLSNTLEFLDINTTNFIGNIESIKHLTNLNVLRIPNNDNIEGDFATWATERGLSDLHVTIGAASSSNKLKCNGVTLLDIPHASTNYPQYNLHFDGQGGVTATGIM